MDFERNLGPCCSLLKAHFTTSSYNVRGLDLGHQKHYRPSCISYERNRLLSLRHWSKHYCSPEFLGKSKSLDLLRYRGKRAGRLNKQKSTGNGLRIPVICSGRRHYRVSLRGCLSYFHPVNFASKIILLETLSTERLYLGKN